MWEIKRSPAKVCWWVMFNGVLIDTRPTKVSAESCVAELKETTGVC